jgi:hypothetical protein
MVVCLGLLGCTTWHGATLPGYEGLVLGVQSGKGAESLRMEAGFDPTLEAWITEHGDPDYIHVVSGSVVELCYIAQDELVTFTRGWSSSSSAVATTPIPSRLSDRFNPADRRQLGSLRAALPKVPRPKPQRRAVAKNPARAPAAGEVPAKAALSIDERDEPYRKDLLGMVDKVRRENSRCARAESVTRSIAKSTPSDPAWFVLCTDAQGTEFKVYFSRSDIRSGKRMTAPAHLDQDAAIERCKRHARWRSKQPSTVGFSWFDMNVQEYPDGSTRVNASFTVDATSGRSAPSRISCLMDASELFEAEIEP